MLDEGSSTNPVPVFVADGRRRHHAVRLLGGTLGLLLAGWLAALAVGIVGVGSLPAIPFPDGGPPNTAPAPHPDPVVAKAPAGPAGDAEPMIQRAQVQQRSANSARRTASPQSGSHPTGSSTRHVALLRRRVHDDTPRLRR